MLQSVCFVLLFIFFSCDQVLQKDGELKEKVMKLCVHQRRNVRDYANRYEDMKERVRNVGREEGGRERKGDGGRGMDECRKDL